MATLTYRNWKVSCEACNLLLRVWEWSDRLPIPCTDCGQPTLLWEEALGKAPGIIGDNIPGGVEIRHLDPQPKRYYSKTDIKRACNERGLKWADDTPGKPYNVSWSGKVRQPERPKPLIGQSSSET